MSAYLDYRMLIKVTPLKPPAISLSQLALSKPPSKSRAKSNVNLAQAPLTAPRRHTNYIWVQKVYIGRQFMLCWYTL